MSHRRVKNVDAYDDCHYYEDDDIYGHSVEDDQGFGVSPTTASMYMYSQHRQRLPSEPALDNVMEDEEADTTCATDADAFSSNKSKADQQLKFAEPVALSRLDINCSSVQVVRSNIGSVTRGFEVSSAPTTPSHGNSGRYESSAIGSSSSNKVLNRSVVELMLPPDNSFANSNCISPGLTRRQQAAAANAAAAAAHVPLTVSNAPDRVDAINAYTEHQKLTGNKQHLNLVVCGHVDAGKSTLMGHLLYQLGYVSDKTMHKFETESRKIGKASFAYAWVLDETEEERSRGVTVDVAQAEFNTTNRSFTLLDAPGHRDFIPNMLVGATQADAALLVVNAAKGEFETGLKLGGQTQEHALLLRSLGISQLAVAVNKMDAVNWEKDRFEDVSSRILDFLMRLGFERDSVAVLPVSGLLGLNLTKALDGIVTASWYNGPTLLDTLDKLHAPERAVGRPARFVVSDVLRGTVVSGRLSTGALRPGDKLRAFPSQMEYSVKQVLLNDAPLPWAFSGDTLSLNLLASNSATEPGALALGTVLSPLEWPLRCVTRLRADVLVLQVEQPITRGFACLFHTQNVAVEAQIRRILAIYRKGRRDDIEKRNPRCLLSKCSASVEIQLNSKLPLEIFSESRDLGRFLLRVRGVTIAAGQITRLLEDHSASGGGGGGGNGATSTTMTA